MDICECLEMETGCECSPEIKGVAFCERHKCLKSEHWRMLCRTKPERFEQYENGKGPCHEQTPPKKPGLGDYVAKVIHYVAPSLEECCACRKRREWLNKFGMKFGIGAEEKKE